MRINPKIKKVTALGMLLLGRILFGAVFFKDAADHFSSEMISDAQEKGIYMAQLFVPLSGVIAIIGGLLIITGYQTKLGAGLIVKVLIPVTVVMHDFWNFSSPHQVEFEFDQFVNNLGMLGAAFMLIYFGAGPLSIDAYLKKRKEQKTGLQKSKEDDETGVTEIEKTDDNVQLKIIRLKKVV
jgi:putative oxidoreductase